MMCFSSICLLFYCLLLPLSHSWSTSSSFLFSQNLDSVHKTRKFWLSESFLFCIIWFVIIYSQFMLLHVPMTFHCMQMLPFSYPFIILQTPVLLLRFSYWEQCCYEHGYTNTFSRPYCSLGFPHCFPQWLWYNTLPSIVYKNLDFSTFCYYLFSGLL